MQFIPRLAHFGLRRALRLMFGVALAVAVAAACGSSDDAVVDQVTSAASDQSESGAAESVETDSSQAEPIATTPPVTSSTDTGSDENDSVDVPEPTAVLPSAPSAPSVDEEPANGSDEPTGSDDAPQAAPATTDSNTGLSRAFGANDGACQSVAAQPSRSPEGLQQASDCLFAEIDAGRPVVVDFAVLSTEGEPIYYRYVFDGQQILFINDSRLDSFGSQRVVAQFCESLRPGPLVPVPTGCNPTTSSGIADADR